jgi:hypothetical protein
VPGSSRRDALARQQLAARGVLSRRVIASKPRAAISSIAARRIASSVRAPSDPVVRAMGAVVQAGLQRGVRPARSDIRCAGCREGPQYSERIERLSD